MKHEFRLEIVYPSKFYPNIDSDISECLNKKIYSSGMGLGERDLSFFYKDINTLMKDGKKVRKMINKKHNGKKNIFINGSFGPIYF